MAIMLIGINEDEGTLGKLLNDEGVAEDLEVTMENLKQGSEGLEQNMEAAKNNFLLRGYFRKKKEKRKSEKSRRKRSRRTR